MKKKPAKKTAAKAQTKSKPKPKAKPKKAAPKAKAKAKKPAKEKVADDAIIDDSEFAPATLQKLEKGGYAIFFDIGAFDGALDVEEAFSEIGSGNGYEWEAVLAPALEKRDPAAFSAVDWSPEADTFVASSSDKGPLAVLAAVLRDVVKDQSSLVQAVKAHDPERT